MSPADKSAGAPAARRAGTVGWGFLGAGHIATANVGPAVRGLAGAELRAAAGRDRRRTGALGAAACYPDYADLLADDSVDVVYIALHNSAHAQWAVRALEAGRHVLCEKPLGLSAAEVETMARAAAASGRLLVEATWNRWHPQTRDLARLLAEGVVGEVRHVAAVFDGADPDPDNYRRVAALGGGALWDVGCYAVAAVLAAYGWAAPTVTAVRRDTWPGGSADVRTSVDLGFAHGTATVLASLSGTGQESLVITGTGGTLCMDHPFTAGRGPAEIRLETVRGSQVRHYPPVDPYALMAAEVTRAAAGDPSAFLVPLDQSLAVAGALDSIRRAAPV
ncbi:oxidoreductase [Streptomyces sulfonofaciens]|uniref:Oxidoreductase n=1 Tax=Streptomyces sulfonofaciens TaxID=68272 RepID=A0A919GIW8_9ACTN|nr:Gfo/Idh/MocA family oxidoreductase [Streptomyces sulfonofaciens]GHH84813.1 oxidoreductase [Streptomyces sulfonofaciens]